MHSADPTSGRSVRKTPRGHERANTFNWGMCRNFWARFRSFWDTTGPDGTLGAESGDATRGRRLSYHPAVTATGEGRP